MQTSTTPHTNMRDRLTLAGITIDLIDQTQVIESIARYAHRPDSRQLAILSANLDHIHHFGNTRGKSKTGALTEACISQTLDTLTLLDGIPLVRRANRLTGNSWPKLSGSDLIEPILDLASQQHFVVGFLGGSAETHAMLKQRMNQQRPELVIGGYWSPNRDELTNSTASRKLAQTIAAAQIDILLVCLGKPRQERWIRQWSSETNAGVLLAFGAVVDFLAYRVPRCPSWISDRGLEWAWRLTREPKRLGRRYLLQAPPAYFYLRTQPVQLLPAASAPNRQSQYIDPDQYAIPQKAMPGFSGPHERTEVAAIVVTFNSAQYLGKLLDSLLEESITASIRTMVVDNNSSDDSVAIARSYPGVEVLALSRNIGYAGAINLACRRIDRSDSILVLNPDLTIMPGSIRQMLERLSNDGVGIVAPRMLKSDNSIFYSIRREPSILRSLGDAAFGSHFPTRPPSLSEMEQRLSRYTNASRIDWATGAALLIRREVAIRVGPWEEEFFLFSEETDYCRRVRESGHSVWYEPKASVIHVGGGSGSNPELAALLAVNRIKYVAKHNNRRTAALARIVVLTGELLRSHRKDSRRAVRYLLRSDTWKNLPSADSESPLTPVRALTASVGAPKHGPSGSIVIPAHNEEYAIGRTLQTLLPLTVSESTDIIVVCNGCTDKTAAVARKFPGVSVTETDQASKIAALNIGDQVAKSWPRIYLDADVVLPAHSASMIMKALDSVQPMVGRPPVFFNSSASSWIVRRFFRMKRRVMEQGDALWGGGVYAMNEAAHQRFSEFPTVIADDLWIDSQFGSHEKFIFDTSPTRVECPRVLRDLLHILRRTSRGNNEQRSTAGTRHSPDLPDADSHHLEFVSHNRTSRSTFANLAKSARTPTDWMDLAIYSSLVTFARLDARIPRRDGAWERDNSSRRHVQLIQSNDNR